MNNLSTKLAMLPVIFLLGCQPAIQLNLKTPGNASPATKASASTQKTSAQQSTSASASDGSNKQISDWVGFADTKSSTVVGPIISTPATRPVEIKQASTETKVESKTINQQMPDEKKLDPTSGQPTVGEVKPAEPPKPATLPAADPEKLYANTSRVSHPTTVPTTAPVTQPSPTTIETKVSSAAATTTPATHPAAMPIGKVTPHATPSTPSSTQPATVPTTQILSVATTSPASSNPWISTPTATTKPAVSTPAAPATTTSADLNKADESDAFSLIFAIGVPILLFLLWIMIKNRNN